MAIAAFQASYLKIRRARVHIKELGEQIDTYLQREPFYLEIVDAPSFSTGRMWVARVTEEVPLDFAAIIGDAIHNLRTALDLLACDLVRANGGTEKEASEARF